MDIEINAFEPRPYQTPLAAAVNAGFRKIIAVLPRRARQGSHDMELVY